MSSAVRRGERGPVGRCGWPISRRGGARAGAVELLDESEVWDCWMTSVDFLEVVRRAIFLGSPLSVALGSCEVGVSAAAANGKNAGPSSSSSASSDLPSLFDENRAGRRIRRLCAGSESDESAELDSASEEETFFVLEIGGVRVGGDIESR